jgi:uncharacterized protein YndB with AHSA1/START domain
MQIEGEHLRQLTLTRLIDAPRERVWQAWSDQELIRRWWGPNHFTSPSCRLDFRVGGVTLVCMHGPAGTEWDRDLYNTWTYCRIVPLEVIEFLQNPSDEHGKPADPAALGLRGDFPLNVRTVVELRPASDKTELTVTEYGFPAGEMLAQAEAGLHQTLDKLVEVVTTA